jgi:protein-tyrosine phosphatase
MKQGTPHHILMVCLGNICRSPMAEGIMRHKARKYNLQIVVDSAGTGGWHAGDAPDERAIEMMRTKGIDISSLVARKFLPEDYDRFHAIYVMDATNYQDVMRLARHDADKAKVEMILNLSEKGRNRPVPDPYYGGMDGFENVYRLLDDACEKIAQQFL